MLRAFFEGCKKQDLAPIPERADTPEYSLAGIWALFGVIVANTDPLNVPVLGLSALGVAVLGGVASKAYPGAPAA